MSARATWTWEFPVARDRLWHYLADTDWVNEHAGLPRIAARYEPLPEGGTRRIAWFRKGPMLFEWEERPTIWERPSFFAVERIYRHGPLARFFTSTALEELEPERTQVAVEVDLEAATPLTIPLLPLIMAEGKRGANRAFRLAATLASREQKTPAAADLGGFAPLRQARIDPRVVSAIAGFVESAENRDLQRMRPYELADRWQLPRSEVLRGFLTSTRLGLFNLSWSVICPGCRGPSPAIESLTELHRGYHCEACNLQFDASFDRSVEVTFDARPLGRAVEQGLFCIASPVRSSHVYAQAVVAPEGGTKTFDLSLEKGAYDINVVGSGLAPFVANEEEAARDLEAVVYPLTGIDAPHAVRIGDVRVGVTNELDREAVVRIEDGRWPDTIVTAAQVTALQDFRDLFSSEVLAPGLEMGIETMAVLFTDLIGSTAMYSRTGDAPAFRIVTDHFAVVQDIVARHQGAIVKTIGDAVMAAFVDPARCLDAALELDDSVQTLHAQGEPLRLRVGFHAGPCIAMRANDRVDYFGTTVNLAARLQSLAKAGEVTLARSVAERPAIAQRLRDGERSLTYETLAIKGFPQPIDVVRIAGRE